jgi:hypothetical protein
MTAKPENPRFAVFPNGTSYMMWMDQNCDRCVKCYDERKHPDGRSDCDIENAIAIAAATDGTLLHDGMTPMNKADAIAKRLNCPHNVAKRIECGEPATHRVTRDGTTLEWFMCERHASQRKGYLYTVTALNAPGVTVERKGTP